MTIGLNRAIYRTDFFLSVEQQVLAATWRIISDFEHHVFCEHFVDEQIDVVVVDCMEIAMKCIPNRFGCFKSRNTLF